MPLQASASTVREDDPLLPTLSYHESKEHDSTMNGTAMNEHVISSGGIRPL